VSKREGASESFTWKSDRMAKAKAGMNRKYYDRTPEVL
jgi:hypothetical protein